MQRSVRTGLVLFAAAATLLAQETGSQIRGRVIMWAGEPIPSTAVQAWQSGQQKPVQAARTAPDGSYELQHLPPGIYDLKVSSYSFVAVEIKDVQIEPAEPKTLPAIRLESDACGSPHRPTRYRLSPDSTGTWGIEAVVESETHAVIAKAKATLFFLGKGRIGSTVTTEEGRFSFSGLRGDTERYVMTIQQDGFFTEELTDLSVQPGFETIYPPITLESCSPGHCQPSLKAIPVLVGCA